MKLDSKQLLKRLGSGASLAEVCDAAGWSREQFDAWWRQECRRRVTAVAGCQTVQGLRGPVRIERGRRGIPRVYAEGNDDLFFGFGYATAQDRLFQLDYLRRKARGRLAEILGPEALDSDVLYRTLGLGRIAIAEWESFDACTRELVQAYAAGINALIEQSRGNWPIEFDLLDYEPEPWHPTDSLAIVGEFRWYLTGRFYVITIPELVKRAVGDGPLYRAFLRGEADEESIMPAGSYPPGHLPPEAVGGSVGDPGGGSNNWVLAASRSASGKPQVANDPHIPFQAVSIWHQIRLRGGSLNLAGVALAGMPGIMIGRSEYVAWGITNNLSSQRDLYQEKTDPAHPGCFFYDGRWEPARERQEIIAVRGAASVVQTIRYSRNGPLVHDLLPPAARATGPVSLRWLGFERCGWVPALIAMNQARSAAEFREATRPWIVPTFNLVFADADGHIGHQCVGRIPLRKVAERGYRPGWDPEHQWQGVIPFECMPQQIDPARGYAITANNRLAPDDYPYPLAGTWSSGYRARRIREVLEEHPLMSWKDSQRLHYDVYSGRAAAAVPHLVRLLQNDAEPRVREAVSHLRQWDYRMTTESVAASVFHLFFVNWCRAVVAERLPPEQVEFVAGGAAAVAARLLAAEDLGWFVRQTRERAVRAAFVAALDELTQRFGPRLDDWRWGRLHTLLQPHFLSGRGALGELLDLSGLPVPGDGTTVCSNTTDASHRAFLGAGYRMVVDLADPQHGLWAVEVAGTSGHPGSPHYADQIVPWNRGEYHYIPLTGPEA